MKVLIQSLLFFTLFLSLQARAASESCLIDKSVSQVPPLKAEYVIQCGGFLILTFESANLDHNFVEIQNFMNAFGYDRLTILSFNLETSATKILAEK